jgi:predicted RNA-binding protein YlqC (UPF0109 family)
MREFIEFIAKHLVDHPDAVRLEQVEQDNQIVLKLSVGENEVGKVIGRKGRTARALRTLPTQSRRKKGSTLFLRSSVEISSLIFRS